ncbi:MAG TPA: TIM barrel protein [Methanoregula sp.]|nr:TIM barrel protein [Methanoregula sp.]
MALKIGIETGMLPGGYTAALDHFSQLQTMFPLTSAELQTESSLYAAHYTPKNRKVPDVEILGVHLPFMDLDPFSGSGERRRNSRNILFSTIQQASDIDADYVVFHARAPGPVNRGDVWAPLLSELAETSEDSGMKFCLENADDLYDIGTIHRLLHELPEINLCLDIGHLYEHTFTLFTRYLPLLFDRRLAETLRQLEDHIQCLHIHNHNGFMAHQVLTGGKIDLSPVRQMSCREIPLILEPDYRGMGNDAIERDICFLEKLIL